MTPTLTGQRRLLLPIILVAVTLPAGRRCLRLSNDSSGVQIVDSGPEQQRPHQRQELGIFPRPQSPIFDIPQAEELTMRQLYDCFTELDAACRAGGYSETLKVDTGGKSPRDWRVDPGLLGSLRLALFRAHREDRPGESLALCFTIQTPDIFDQSRPRQDPVCLHLADSRFRLETDILLAQKTLCRWDTAGVFFLCRRQPRVTQPVQPLPTQPSLPRPPSASASAAGDADAVEDAAARQRRRRIAEEKLKCALVWIVGVLLTLIIVLVTGILVHTLLHRKDYALAAAHYTNDKTSLVEENGRCSGSLQQAECEL